MRWVLGSQSAVVEGHMHDAIAMGLGHLSADVPKEFNEKTNHPVYIGEPLVILSLSTLFERLTRERGRDWIVKSFRTSRDPSSSGILFGEVMLLVLVQHFGGKFAALDDMFHFSPSSPWTSRKFTLVSLRRTAEGVMQCCPVSWNSGCSDRFCFKAKSPIDVVEFLNDPKGKPFLFPDNHMGPDLICFLQDEQTKELILLVFQAKLHKVIDAKTWQSALTSVIPEFFYTIRVCFSALEFCKKPLIHMFSKDAKRSLYAPVASPDLLEEFLHATLGPKASEPAVATYRSKLKGPTLQENVPAPLPQRQTPGYLHVIAASDGEQQKHLEATASNVAGLKWTVVEEYTGLTADAMRQQVGAVH